MILRQRVGLSLFQRKAELTEPGVFVPVAALEFDLAVDHVEEAAAAQNKFVAGRLEGSSARPFEDCPFFIFEEVFYFGEGVGDLCEELSEVRVNGFATGQRFSDRDLNIDRVFVIEGGEAISVVGVHKTHPSL